MALNIKLERNTELKTQAQELKRKLLLKLIHSMEFVCTPEYYFPFLLVFIHEVIFRSRVTGACPVTADCVVAMSSCENNSTECKEQ